MSKKSTKKALLLSALSLFACVAMLIGSTFAWFTDSVTSAGNKIQAGTLQIDLEMLDGGNWVSIKDNPQPIFNYDKWEPGYTDATVLKIVNEGSLALKWVAKFVSEYELTILADVIDVYVKSGTEEIAMPTDRSLDGYTKVGTVADFVNTIEETTNGYLLAGNAAYLGIVLKMQESAGNEYQGLPLCENGGAFDIQIFATQYTYEKDSFDELYDEKAPELEPATPVIPEVTVTSSDELVEALANVTEPTVIDATGVSADINTIGTDAAGGKKQYTIPGDVTIKNMTFTGTYRGGNYIFFGGTSDQKIVFENCTFELVGRVMGFGFLGQDGAANSVEYNNCTFKGAIILEFPGNPNGVATYNNCTFTRSASGNSYVMASSGTHIFNGCTFDYTGATQSNMGIVDTCSINATSESDGSSETTVILNGCTRINCGTRKYGAKSTLTIQ